jgi:predicted dienelactone hydrolase
MLEADRHVRFPCRGFTALMVAGFASCWQAPGWLFLLTVLSAPAARADQVGFALVSAPDPPGEPLRVGIWYPTKAAASEADLGLFTQVVATNAPVDGHAHPLIVMSHGNGGSLEGHYDTALALARAGFVVAAMTHTGDNYRDQSKATALADRPRAVHAVIDYMVSAWPQHGAIDPRRIGAFGFSSGGFTVLVAVGGIPDLKTVAPYCALHSDTYVCNILKAHPVDADHPIPDEAWIADRRIKAAVVAAPAIGFTFGRSGLRTVRIPIQLWRAADDHILPSPDYAEAVRDALPQKPEYHVVPGADHFDFLAPCSEALARVAPDICRDDGGFDRAAFHRDFDREVVRFFKTTLSRQTGLP